MKVAVIIGHDMKSPGAYSQELHTSEYMYNSEVASYLHQFDVYKRPLGGGYTTQMRSLAAELKPKNYDLIVELHFNSFNKSANGCETISYPGNSFTKKLGAEYCRLVTNKYCTENRGAKEGEKGGRGWGFLSLMPAPAIILEGFFGDHPEALLFKNQKEYAGVIIDWLKSCGY